MTGRIRSIKPEWLDDERMAAASDEARVLSVALILMSDDYGRGRASIAMIASEAWRYHLEREDGAHAPEILARASRALRELVAMQFVVVYEVSGQRYFEIRNWSKHQKVDRPSKPRIPPPPSTETAEETETREGLARPSRGSIEAPPSDSPNTRDRSGSPTSDLRPPTKDPERDLEPPPAAPAAPSRPSSPKPQSDAPPKPDPEPRIAELSGRYPAELVAAVHAACSRHRKSGVMAGSVWLATLEKLAAYEAGRVVDAMRIFADRYSTGEWDESYLVGIVRNNRDRPAASGWRAPTTQDEYRASAGATDLFGRPLDLGANVTDEDRARVERIGSRRAHG